MIGVSIKDEYPFLRSCLFFFVTKSYKKNDECVSSKTCIVFRMRKKTNVFLRFILYIYQIE